MGSEMCIRDSAAHRFNGSGIPAHGSRLTTLSSCPWLSALGPWLSENSSARTDAPHRPRDRKYGHKKRGFFRISFTLMPDKNYLLQHSPSAFSAQSLVESHFSAQQASVESHFSVHSVQAAASVVAAAAAASPSAAFLFELPQQLTIATAAITTTKEKIFFITSNV
mgnify:FL=1